MDKNNKSDILRKLIREEVQKAIRAEMPKLLKEYAKSLSVSNTILESEDDDDIPLTLNTSTSKPKVNINSGNNVLNSMLMETAQSMQEEDWIQFGSQDVNSFGAMAGSVPQQPMGGAFSPETDISRVQVNNVPDFNNLMDSMIKKGQM